MKKNYNDSKNFLAIFFVLLICLGFMQKNSNADIIGVDPFSDKITTYADNIWTVLDSATLSLSGFTIDGAVAVTWNSDNLLFYAIVRQGQGQSSIRKLVTVDPSTGVCTDVGTLGANYSSLTYSSTTGTLYAIRGSGSGTGAASIYSLDINTAASFFLGGPYLLDDGQVIAYNYDDGFIYHWTGFPAADIRMGKIDVNTWIETEIIQSGDPHSEVYGAVYIGGGVFAVTDIDAKSFTITPSGVVTAQATMYNFARGLGYIDPLLPVELSSFTSVISGRNVELNWTTASETNNSGFEIERSNVRGQTSNDWTKIGFVNGNGTINTLSNYSYTDNSLNSGSYSYRLKQIDFNGNFEYFNLSNEVNIGVPGEFSLSQNYPNPFNPSTQINFDIPVDGKVSIKLYDISGKEMSTLVNEFKTAGYYTASFNAAGLPSGAYFYTISSEGFTATKKMMLLK